MSLASSEFRSALEAGDVTRLRAIWSKALPGMPQPKDTRDAMIIMHRARTEAESIPLAKRLYSHRWLCDRILPSGLPDQLRPKPEQEHPTIVGAVGISVNCSSEYLRPAALEIRKAMETSVEESYADGRTDPDFIKTRLMAAREKAQRLLFG